MTDRAIANSSMHRHPTEPPWITLIVAHARNRVIGHRRGLPWRLPEDLRRFRQLTLGHACVMGRGTWESLGKRPLPRRLNIVVSTQLDGSRAGMDTTRRALRVARSWAEAKAIAADEIRRQALPDVLFVIGGGALYAAAMPEAGTIERTLVEIEPPGDAWFPELDATWRIVTDTGPRPGPPPHRFQRLVRIDDTTTR